MSWKPEAQWLASNHIESLNLWSYHQFKNMGWRGMTAIIPGELIETRYEIFFSVESEVQKVQYKSRPSSSNNWCWIRLQNISTPWDSPGDKHITGWNMNYRLRRAILQWCYGAMQMVEIKLLDMGWQILHTHELQRHATLPWPFHPVRRPCAVWNSTWLDYFTWRSGRRNNDIHHVRLPTKQMLCSQPGKEIAESASTGCYFRGPKGTSQDLPPQTTDVGFGFKTFQRHEITPSDRHTLWEAHPWWDPWDGTNQNEYTSWGMKRFFRDSGAVGIAYQKKVHFTIWRWQFTRKHQISLASHVWIEIRLSFFSHLCKKSCGNMWKLGSCGNASAYVPVPSCRPCPLPNVNRLHPGAPASASSKIWKDQSTCSLHCCHWEAMNQWLVALSWSHWYKVIAMCCGQCDWAPC